MRVGADRDICRKGYKNEGGGQFCRVWGKNKNIADDVEMFLSEYVYKEVVCA
jgi:hypothetical protein